MKAPQLGARKKTTADENTKLSSKLRGAAVVAMPSAKPAEIEQEEDILMTPQQRAKIHEMTQLLTNSGQARLTDVVRNKIKELSADNHLFFVANDVAYKLLEPYKKSHTALITDEKPFFEFSKKIGNILAGMAKSFGLDKVIRTEHRMSATFQETPVNRTAYGFRWGAVTQKETSAPIAAATVAPAAVIIPAAAPIDISRPHPDIEPTEESKSAVAKFQELISSMNYQQCNFCIELILVRKEELYKLLIQHHEYLLTNSLAQLRGNI